MTAQNRKEHHRTEQAPGMAGRRDEALLVQCKSYLNIGAHEKRLKNTTEHYTSSFLRAMPEHRTEKKPKIQNRKRNEKEIHLRTGRDRKVARRAEWFFKEEKTRHYITVQNITEHSTSAFRGALRPLVSF